RSDSSSSGTMRLMRRVVRDAGLTGLLLLSTCSRALALNAALDLSQYAHTAWTSRDGFLPGTSAQTVAQTADGYIWIGTDAGLFRFDGLKPTGWQPPAGNSLPSNDVRRLLTGRDGTLWIGTERGLASWKDGSLARYQELDRRSVATMLQDRDGAIWVRAYALPRWTLCMVEERHARCYDDDGPGGDFAGLFEDSKGNLWTGTPKGLWRWKPGVPQFFPLSAAADYFQGLSEDDDGTLLIAV